jgi:hypothetical protein
LTFEISVAFELKTSRGRYNLVLAKEPQALPDATLLTLSLERHDGIEKVALQCRIDKKLAPHPDSEEGLTKLAHFIERHFEMTREYALKSIRSERKMLELVFDESNRGPF